MKKRMISQNPGRFNYNIQEPDLLARSGLRVCGLVLVRAPRLPSRGYAGQWSNPSNIVQVIIGICSRPSRFLCHAHWGHPHCIAFIIIPIRQLHLGIVSGLGVAVLTSVFTPVSGGQVIILEVLFRVVKSYLGSPANTTHFMFQWMCQYDTSI